MAADLTEVEEAAGKMAAAAEGPTEGEEEEEENWNCTATPKEQLPTTRKSNKLEAEGLEAGEEAGRTKKMVAAELAEAGRSKGTAAPADGDAIDGEGAAAAATAVSGGDGNSSETGGC